MKASEVKMLWKLVASGEARPLSAADMALLLRIRFALLEYESQSGERQVQFNDCRRKVD
jgi:hypothetical protein